MGQRNPCVIERSGDRGDTGYHLKGNSRLREFIGLFAPTAEQVRIASLETNHGLAGLGLLHQQLIEVVLRYGMRRGPLAPVNALSSGGCQRQTTGLHQRVVDDNIGTRQHLGTAPGQQTFVARTCSHQIDHPLGLHECETVTRKPQATKAGTQAQRFRSHPHPRSTATSPVGLESLGPSPPW